MSIQSPARKHRSQMTNHIQTRAGTLLLSFLMTLAGPLCAQETQPDGPLEIRVRLDKTEALVADRVELELTVVAPQGVAVRFPDPGEQLGGLAIVDVRDLPDLPDGSRRLWLRRYGLESLTAGEFTIPPQEISFVDRRQSESQSGFQTSAPRSLTIRSSLEGVEDPTRFRDIKSVVLLPEPRQSGRPWLAWAAGTLGMLAVIGTAVVVLRRRKPVRTPRELALNALDELDRSDALQQGDGRRVVIQLTEILRTFIHRQFDIPAFHMTTREFLDQVRDDPRLSDEIQRQLGDLLSSADAVKFAALIPNPDDLRGVVDEARQLIFLATEVAENQEVS